MPTATWWKRFYADERARMGEAGVDALLERAPRVGLPSGGALVFPHTRLERSGAMVAAVARALVDAGADDVVALGVLHGGRERDAERVQAARNGDPDAIASLRRVHGPTLAAGEDGDVWAEEFSLDGFAFVLGRACARAGRAAPRVRLAYPFLVGADPASVPGAEELATELARGAALVATTDPLHHGAGYGTPEAERRDPRDPATRAWAEAAVASQLDALAAADFEASARACAAHRSDFRDVGPVLAALRPGGRGAVVDLALVDYGDVLGAPDPTWVAGALVEVA